MIAGVPRGEILSRHEAALALGLSDSRVRALILDGRLKATKVGQSWVIYRSDLDRFAAKPRVNGRPAAKRS
jgi:excisionase family DNA binding protein